jgi:hypothetical protein
VLHLLRALKTGLKKLTASAVRKLYKSILTVAAQHIIKSNSNSSDIDLSNERKKYQVILLLVRLIHVGGTWEGRDPKKDPCDQSISTQIGGSTIGS